MAILKVAQLGHPVLREVAREVTGDELASAEFQAFLDDLLETMSEYDGIGLAANQVHIPVRVAVLALTEERGAEFFVNPVLTVLPGGIRHTWEGCLSVEGLRGLVERPDHVRVDALDRDGQSFSLEIEGFGAVVVQHELDHLDGILYIDRALPRSLVFVDQYRRWGPPDEFMGMETDDDTTQDMAPVETER